MKQDISSQFRYLDTKHPELWPSAPKRVLYFFVFLLSMLLFWVLLVKPFADDYWGQEAREAELKTQYEAQVKSAAPHDSLKVKERQMQARIDELKKRLPTQTEMDSVLRQVAQAGDARNLKVTLFKPSDPEVKDFYAVITVDMKIVGYYHQIGAFLSDIAAIPRVLSISSFSLDSNSQNNKIEFKGALKVVRALTEEELKKQKDTDKKKKKGEQ